MSEKSEQSFDTAWHLPKKFAISPELLAQNDARQKEWRESFGSFAQASPRQRARSRALLTRDNYEATGKDHLLPDQLAELAEAYAELGRFDIAAETSLTPAMRGHYAEIWEAVLRDEADWCEHPEQHQYAERDVFSVKLDADVHLLRCNICGLRNVAPLPDHIAKGREKRARARELYSGKPPIEVKKELSR